MRRGVAYALSRIGGEAKECVPHLIPLLKDPDAEVCRTAVDALYRIGPPFETTAVPHLIPLLKNPDAGVAAGALFTHCTQSVQLRRTPSLISSRC